MQKQEMNVFKMSLSFTSEAAMNTTDLTNLKDDLVQACEEHNYQGENPVVLLTVHPRRINLIINMKESEETSEPTLKELEKFMNILASDLGWNRFAEPGRPLFQLTLKVKMTPGECQDLYSEGKRSFINNAHANRFREWVQPHLSEQSRPKRSGGRRPPVYYEEPEMQENETMSQEDALETLESFVGIDPLMAEVHNAVLLAKSMENEGKASQGIKFPYALVIEKSEGVKLGHVLKLMAVIYAHLGFSDDCVYDMVPRHVPFMRENRFSTNFGINVVEVDTNDVTVENNQVFLKQVEVVAAAGPGHVFVFLMDEDNKKNNQAYKNWLHRHLYCREVQLPAYTSHQLTLMAETMASRKGFNFSEQAQTTLQGLVEAAVESRGSKYFSVLQVQQMVQEITTRHILEQKSHDVKKTIEAEDVEQYFQQKHSLGETEVQQEGTQPFNALIGLEDVKGKIEELGHVLKLQQQMRVEGVEMQAPTYHMVFTGNPGTGKTVSARLVGEIFKEMGLLDKGHFVEVGRDDLVAGYVGQTALKTKAKIREAMGGVLFIDEAYSLFSEGKLDYGHEAVATLVKEMENNRDKLVVILAGYPKDMDTFLKMNAGLKDRIPHKIHFPDYNAKELTAIFSTMVPKGLSATSTSLDMLQRHFGEAMARSKDSFSNGRYVRNLWERIEQKRAHRLAKVKAPTKKQLLTITAKDVEAALADQDFNGTWERTKNKSDKPIGFGV